MSMATATVVVTQQLIQQAATSVGGTKGVESSWTLAESGITKEKLPLLVHYALGNIGASLGKNLANNPDVAKLFSTTMTIDEFSGVFKLAVGKLCMNDPAHIQPHPYPPLCKVCGEPVV